MTPDEVHVWCARLDGTDFRGILSPDELARAGGFLLERDRIRFIWRRGFLRTVLAGPLRWHPAEVCFSYASGGKPYVAGTELCFNASHSGDLALIAMAWGRELGVDIEAVRADAADSGIAERFFSTGEREALAALSGDRRRRAFFSCWTRKEAYLKARGTGLALPLDRFEVTVAPDAPAALLRAPEGPAEVARWQMQDLPVPAGYAAAIVVAAADREWRLVQRTL